MAVAEDRAALATLAVDLALFAVAVLIWLIVRKYRGDHIHQPIYENHPKQSITAVEYGKPVRGTPEKSPHEISLQNMSPSPGTNPNVVAQPNDRQSGNDGGLMTCLRFVWRASPEEFGAVDITNYFYIHKKLFEMFFLMALLGCVVSIPTNIHFGKLVRKIGSDDVDKGFLYMISCANWASSPTILSLWVMTAVAVCQALIALLYGHKMISQVKKSLQIDIKNRMHQLQRTPTHYEHAIVSDHGEDSLTNSDQIVFFTVCVDGLQPQILQDVAIQGVFESIYPDQVCSTRLILDYSTVLKEKEKLMKAETKLSKLREEYIKSANGFNSDNLSKGSSMALPEILTPLVNESPSTMGQFGSIEDDISNENPLTQRSQDCSVVAAPVTNSDVEWTETEVIAANDPILTIVNGLNGNLGRGTTYSISQLENRFVSSKDMMPALYGPGMEYQAHTRKKLDEAEARVEECKLRLIRAIKTRPLENTRRAFVTFKSTRTFKRALAFQHRQFFYDWGWRLIPAPAPEDILWRNVHVSDKSRDIRWKLGLLVLMIVDFLLTTSALFTDWITPLASRVGEFVNDRTTAVFKLSVLSFVTPAIFFVINSWIMPGAIWVIVAQCKHWKWSSMQRDVLHLNAILLFFNTTILPLVGAISIYTFIGSMLDTIQSSDGGIYQFGTSFAESTLNQSGSFGLRYLLSASFLSNSSQLLQLPKVGMRGLLVSMGVNPPVWRFDLGYWYAYSLSIVFVGMVFSAGTPIVLPCAACACALKYAVDKYNFSIGFWTVSNDSKGKIALEAIRYVFWATAFHLMITSIFSIKGVFHIYQTEHDYELPAGQENGDPTLTNLLMYYHIFFKNVFLKLYYFLKTVMSHPLGIFNVCQFLVAIGIIWKYCAGFKNPLRVLKRGLIHLFYETRRFFKGTDIHHYRHSIKYDLSGMKYSVIKENILLEDVTSQSSAIKYSPPVEREIQEFMSSEKRNSIGHQYGTILYA